MPIEKTMADTNDFVNKNREYLIKQSEMLQTIISRMASNSLTIKQLGITIWTTLMGFGFTNKTPFLFVLAIISLTLLGFLDAYYLYLEQCFRRNFSRLTEVLCSFSPESLEQVERLKGNFITLKQLDRSRALELYKDAIKSWANVPYLIILVITLVILLTT